MRKAALPGANGRPSSPFIGYEGTAIGYDTRSSYWGAHLGLGRALRLRGDNELDVSLRYFYSRTGGDTARVSTGEDYRFSAVSSHRLRLGARLTPHPEPGHYRILRKPKGNRRQSGPDVEILGSCSHWKSSRR